VAVVVAGVAHYGAAVGETKAGGAAVFVRTAVRDAVGWIEFDRPPVNAFEWTMVGQVTGARGDGRCGRRRGLEMALHCHVRFATRDARLGQPEININFIPPVGATQALVRLIGRPAALRYLYDGTLLDAQRAKEIGLVDEVVEPGELRAHVQTYAVRLAAKPPEALTAIRRSITLGGGMSFEDGLALERRLAVALAGTANFREGIAAFLEKRPPSWQR
jgi:enoyl-CoA hydratase/carnithine racemase